MPLRALLLLPSGEQPTIVLNPKPKPSNLTIPKTRTTTMSTSFKDALTSPFSKTVFSSPLGAQSAMATATGTEEDNDDDNGLAFYRTDLGWPFDSDRSKPLPSPPNQSPSSLTLVLDKDQDHDKDNNRGSNQTYQTSLTLPSTSGSSRAGTGTDVFTPPESPSATSTLSRAGVVNGMQGTVGAKKTKPLELPVKRDARGRPILKVTTKLPKIGSALHYHAHPRTKSLVVDEDEDEEEDENDNGERTARDAVDERLQHLMVTTGSPGLLPPPSPSASRAPSPTRLGFPLSNSPPSSRPGSKALEVLGKSTRSSNTVVLDPFRTSQHHPAKRKPTKRKATFATRHQYTTLNPPPPPTKGLPPFKVLSDEDMLDLMGDVNVLMEGRKVDFGWQKKDLSKIKKTTRPKGTRGRYIRLVTLPPLPPTLTLDDDQLLESNQATPRRLRGLTPTVQMEEDIELAEDGNEEDKAIQTVYMSELIGSQFTEPVYCWMYPRLPLISSADSIQDLPPKSYQYPLPHLTRPQYSVLHKLGLLICAVPRGYEGPVPAPLELKDELVAPWVGKPVRKGSSRDSGFTARTGIRDSTLSTFRGSNRDSTSTLGDGGNSVLLSPVGITSPLRNGFGITSPISPLRLRFGGSNSNSNSNSNSAATALGVNVGEKSGSALSPRWGMDGLWSKRSSAASSSSSLRNVEKVVEEEDEGYRTSEDIFSLVTRHSTADDIGNDNNGEENANVDNGERNDDDNNGARWGSTFGSLRTRAHEYYASRSAAASVKNSPMPSPTPSSHSALPEETLETKGLRLTEKISTSSSIGMTTSRSFGSFFSRGGGASTTPSSAALPSMTRSTSASTLTVSSSSSTMTTAAATAAGGEEGKSALDVLREEGIVVKNLDGDGDDGDGDAGGEVLFEFSTLKKKQAELAEASKPAPAPAPVEGRWKWKGRWGS